MVSLCGPKCLRDDNVRFSVEGADAGAGAVPRSPLPTANALVN
jgi:hypothetical protein